MMGTGPFAVPTFRMLLQAGLDLPLLVTRPVVAGRGKTPPPSPMRVLGEASGIPIFDPPDINAASAIEKLQAYHADLLVVCDYGQILSPATLAVSRWGGINLHGSLLPKYRGAAPVQWSVFHGDAQTGVSVIHMTPRLDGGPIVAVRKTWIDDQETAEQLEHRLSEMGVEAVTAALQRLQSWDGVSPLGQAQDPSQVSKAPRLTKQMGAIDWNRPASAIHNQIRAFQPWPGCFSNLIRPSIAPLRLIINQAQVFTDAAIDSAEISAARLEALPPGHIAVGGKNLLIVKTGQGGLSLLQVQPAGKRNLTIDEFLRGYPLPDGTCFES